MTHETPIAEILLTNQAVTFNPNKPYLYSSGLRSPIYCDNRRLISFPQYRTKIVTAMADIIRNEAIACDVIAGTATAGIPWAAWLAERLNKPLVYVRSKAKQHGQANQIEGLLTLGHNVVVIEDLISTGGSVIHCTQALRQADVQVDYCLSIFNYELHSSQQALLGSDLTCHSLCQLSVLLETALRLNMMTPNEKAIIVDWQQQPEAWSQRHCPQPTEH